MSENESFRIADDRLRSRLADAQEWACAGCGADLVAGAATVVYAAPSEGGPANLAPVMVHESCADEQRASFPDWGDARKTLGRAGDPAAAERALKAAVTVHRDAVNAVVEQATAPLHAKIEGLETQIRARDKQKAELEHLVDQQREKVKDVLTKNGHLSEAFKRERASRQVLEQRITKFLQTINDNGPYGLRYLSREEIFAAAECLRSRTAQAPAQG